MISLLIAATALAQAAPCPGFTNCVYTVPRVNFVGQKSQLTYTDRMGLPRTFEFFVRLPQVPGPLPVIVWAHGGGDGIQNAGEGTLGEPSVLTAQAGWLTISPAFRPRTEAQQKALCEYLNATTEPLCALINSPAWDRPFDIQAVLDLLETENRRQGSPLFGRVDMSRVAVGGHSAGSSATLSVAGARREILGKHYGGVEYFEDPRPKAFVGLSPSSPGSSWMFDTGYRNGETSWTHIERPALLVTGAGDAHEQQPRGRRLPFEFMPASGNKYRVWIDDVAFGHGDYGDDPCGAGRAKCTPFEAVWSSSILSFLDAYVLRKPIAIEYLSKGYAAKAAGNAFDVEWSAK